MVWKRCLILVVALLAAPAAAQPLFDAHLHYSAAHAERFAPDEIIAALKRNGVRRAVVTGPPNATTAALHAADPERIVPLANVYRSNADKAHWPHDPEVPARLAAALERGIFRGIGELHIFAADAASPVFRRVVAMAAERELPLQIHGDPQVIDAVFAQAPFVTVLWAHAGSYPYPALIADYLERYPGLYIDTSVRDARIAPGGELAPAWRRLFLDFSDRVLVGVDTFSEQRWAHFDRAVARLRAWLAQLPPAVARRLAHDNAAAIFPPNPGAE